MHGPGGVHGLRGVCVHGPGAGVHGLEGVGAWSWGVHGPRGVCVHGPGVGGAWS